MIDSKMKAELLYDYMTFRAEKEGLKHELDIDFYLDNIECGVKSFFGITLGPRGIKDDAQQPILLEEWRIKKCVEFIQDIASKRSCSIDAAVKHIEKYLAGGQCSHVK